MTKNTDCKHWLSYAPLPEYPDRITEDGNDATAHKCVRCNEVLYRVHFRPSRSRAA